VPTPFHVKRPLDPPSSTLEFLPRRPSTLDRALHVKHLRLFAAARIDPQRPGNLPARLHR